MFVSASELMNEGIGFSMRDEECDFDDTGDLVGIRILEQETHDVEACEERAKHLAWTYEGSDEGYKAYLCNACLGHVFDSIEETGNAIEDFALLDSHVSEKESWPRWAHLADNHREEEKRNLMTSDGGFNASTKEYTDYSLAALGRERRTAALLGWFAKNSMKIGIACKKGHKKYAKQLVNKNFAAIRKIQGLRAASIDAIVKDGEKRQLEAKKWGWHNLYLTKAQLSVLWEAAKEAPHTSLITEV